MSLRWPTRAYLGSIAMEMKEALTSLGWFETSSAFAEHMPITFDPDHDPDAAVAGRVEAPAVNTVGLSVGDVPDYTIQEIGGGLQATNLPMFVDIYGESRGVSLNLSDDIVAYLQGELWKRTRYIPLYDLSESPPRLLTDQACEARLVEASWPANVGTAEWRRAWRTVKFTATVYWVGQGNEPE